MGMRLFFFLLFVSSPLVGISQMQIHFPTERAVFQRDTSNIGFLPISASINAPVDSVKAILKPYTLGFLADTTFSFKLENTSQLGFLHQRIPLKGGWYHLKLESYLKGQIYATDSIQKVGIGEVFIISGQSNAQGLPTYGASGAVDDRVNINTYVDRDYSYSPAGKWSFEHLEAESAIGPTGYSAWCWGVVGDSLVKKLDVPVLFFNTAISGTLSGNWYESSQNLPTLSAIFYGWYFPENYPYGYLQKTLKLQASIFGVRSILWHQGETDVFPGVPNEEETFGYYKGLIEKSRKDFGFNVPWMVSKVAYAQVRTSPAILNAQTRIINLPGFNVFEGPYTDTLMIPRFDGIHFGNTNSVRGLDLLGNAWVDKLNKEFFDSAIPYLPQPLTTLELSCSPIFSFSINDADSLISWNDGAMNTTRLEKTGSFQALVLDKATSNLKITNAINVEVLNTSYDAPRVFSSKDYICLPDDTLALSFQPSERVDYQFVSWSNGKLDSVINIKNGGSYSFDFQNTIGCRFTSDTISIAVIEKPGFANALNLTLNNLMPLQKDTLMLCTADSLIISSDDPYEYLMINSDSTGLANVLHAIDNYTIKGVYGPGCFSADRRIVLGQLPTLQRPVLGQIGLHTLTLSPSDSSLAYQVLYNGLEQSDIQVNLPFIYPSVSGIYSVYTIQASDGLAKCTSEIATPYIYTLPAADEILIFPNPANDEINVEFGLDERVTSIEIINSLGQIVMRKAINGRFKFGQKITVYPLPIGKYELKINGQQKVWSKTFFKY